MPETADVTPDLPQPPPNPVWPRAGEISNVVDLAGAPGETVGVLLVMKGEADPRRDVVLRFENLIGGQGAIPPTAWRVWRAEWVEVRDYPWWWSAETGRGPAPRLVADLLTPWDGPLTIEGREPGDRRHTVAYVELAIPADAAAGGYDGRLHIEGADAKPAEAALRLRVWPWRMPLLGGGAAVLSRVDAGVLLRAEARDPGRPNPPADRWAATDGPHLAAAREHLRTVAGLLREHGVRPVITGLHPRIDVRWPGEITASWDGWDQVTRTLRREGAGVPMEPLVAPIGTGFPDPALFRAPEGESETEAATVHRRAVRAWAAEVQRHLRSTGRLTEAVVLPDTGEGAVVGLLRGGPADGDVSPDRGTTRHRRGTAREFAALVAESAPHLAMCLPIFAPAPAAADGRLGDGRHLGGARMVRSEQFSPGRPAAGGLPVWLAAGDPPFWPSARPEAPRAGVAAWGWAMHRAGVGRRGGDVAALDVGPAAPWSAETLDRFAGGRTPRAADLSVDPASAPGWVYPPAPLGKPGADGPRPSLRLKLLRRAIQDEAMLRALDAALPAGARTDFTRGLLASVGRTAEDGPACRARFGGWNLDGDLWEQHRRALGRMLGQVAAGRMPDVADTLAKLVGHERAEVRLTAVRLVPVHGAAGSPAPGGAGGAGSAARLEVRVRVVNTGAVRRDDPGTVVLGGLPVGHLPVEPVPVPVLDPGGEVEVALSATGPARADPLGPWLGETSPVVVWRRPEGEVRLPVPVLVQNVESVVRPPVIDGELADWADPVAAERFVSVLRPARDDEGRITPAPAPRATSVRAVAEERGLCIAIRCAGHSGDEPMVRAGNRIAREAGLPWGEECVELLFAPGAPAGAVGPAGPAAPARPDGQGGATLYRLTLKRNGVTERAVGVVGATPTEPWAASADVVVACSAERDYATSWTAEVRIPWGAFGGRPAAGAVWSVCWMRHSTAAGDTSAWSATGGDPTLMAGAGLLRFR